MNFLFNVNICRVCVENKHGSDLLGDKLLLEKFKFTTRLSVSRTKKKNYILVLKSYVVLLQELFSRKNLAVASITRLLVYFHQNNKFIIFENLFLMKVPIKVFLVLRYYIFP